MTNTTGEIGHNEPWRYNNRTNTATNTNQQPHTTRPTSHSGFHNNPPDNNSSDNRNGPTCFRCGEQSHMRIECSKESLLHTLQEPKPQH